MRLLSSGLLLLALSAGCVWYEPYPVLTIDQVPEAEMPAAVAVSFAEQHPEAEIEIILAEVFHSRHHGFHDFHIRYRPRNGDPTTSRVTSDGRRSERPPLPPDSSIWDTDVIDWQGP